MTIDQATVVAPSVPYSKESEEAVLGSVFISPEMYYELSSIITSEDFFIHRHRWVWKAFEKLAGDKTPIDLLTVSEYMDAEGQLAEIGGSAFLTALINQVPSSLNACSYAFVVRGHAERRAGISLANAVAGNAYNEAKPFDLAEQAGLFLARARGTGKRIGSKQAASQMIDLLDNPQYMTTGISDIDEKIGGLFPAELSVLAGYQGTGKSAAKLQGARKNAEAGKRVLLIDLEMTAAQTWFRMACGDMGVDMNQIRSGKVGPEIHTKVMCHAAQLGEMYDGKIVIYQSPMTPSDILSAAMVEQPDIIYIDTLKNISGKDPRVSPRDWYDETLKFLRENVAHSEGAGKPHVQVLHHVNRASHRESRKPTLHDLMFAGESDADAIFILYRKETDYAVVNDGSVRTVVPISWITDKSRFGWTGEEEINFKLVNQSFYGMSRKDEHLYRERKDID